MTSAAVSTPTAAPRVLARRAGPVRRVAANIAVSKAAKRKSSGQKSTNNCSSTESDQKCCTELAALPDSK